VRVAARTRLLVRATSLGGVESLIELRRSVEGPHSVAPESLLRLSIGLEHPDDLIADLIQALARTELRTRTGPARRRQTVRIPDCQAK
jgi:cystathionine gamma-synthase